MLVSREINPQKVELSKIIEMLFDDPHFKNRKYPLIII